MIAPLHALFGKRIPGDDALLELCRARFEQAGLAAEMYAGSPESLSHVLRFAPVGARPPMVHLPRTADVTHAEDREWVIGMIRRFGGRLSGLVVHDRHDTPRRLPEMERAAAEVSAALVASGSARLFVEYAAGHTVEEFVALGECLAPFERVGVCVDIGHVGVREARRRFADLARQVGVDLTELRTDDPRLPGLSQQVVDAVAAARGAVITLTEAVARQSNPVHYHLHDGHPLVPGLADHFGFLGSLPVPFLWQGMRSLPLLFGVTGLEAILRAAGESIAEQPLSMTLEIHQGYGRLALDPCSADLFGHWSDLTNAERQNAWLALITESAQLVRGLTAR